MPRLMPEPTDAPTIMPSLGPDASRSTVEVSLKSNVMADGQDGSIIVVTVQDNRGVVMAGLPVELDVAESGATVVLPQGVTDERGVVRSWLKATSHGVKTVRASVDWEGGTVVLADRPTVHFRRVAGLVFESQPEAGRVRYSMGLVRVRLVDDDGNTVRASQRAVTLSLRGGAGTLLGRTTAWSEEGIATFNDVWVDAEGTGYTLVAQAQGLPMVSSSAFDVVDPIRPDGPSLSAGDITPTSIQIQWSAVGDDLWWGTATAYELRYATTFDLWSDEHFAAATLVHTDAPQAPGTRETVTLTGLVPDTTYHVRLKVTDSAGNAASSMLLSVVTPAEGPGARQPPSPALVTP